MVHSLNLMFRQHRGEQQPHSNIFGDIYANRRWGGSRAQQLDFCSGLGSFPENSTQYEDAVIRFIRDNNIASLTDIGCGDFQVSQRILGKVGRKIRYTGVDVVPALIERNNRLFANEHVSFVLADVTSDPLPAADLILAREVLQHLSNDSIRIALDKFKTYPFALITNGVANNPVRKNIDILPGASTRASLGSGLWLESPPFNFPCTVLLSMPHAGGGAALRTVVYRSESLPGTVR
jgi:SAM-dependent methyltransferase